MNEQDKEMRIRFLLRSVYLKGQADANEKKGDLSWEDKIVSDFKFLEPKEEDIKSILRCIDFSPFERGEMSKGKLCEVMANAVVDYLRGKK